MKPITVAHKRSSLLKYASSRLTPEVFSHPVWIRFGMREPSASLDIANDLLSAANHLQAGDPATSCQVLMLCAAYQNHAGRQFHAIKATQQALTLARNARLSKETIWALWGICAISAQQGNYEQASASLVDLQSALSEQDDWILAGFIDVLRQSFDRLPKTGQGYDFEWPHYSAFGDPLDFSFNLLLQWGFSLQTSETEYDAPSGKPVNPPAKHLAVTQSFFSAQHWQGRWHSLVLAIRGELSFQWKKNSLATAHQGNSFFEFVLSVIRLVLTNRNIDTRTVDDSPEINNIVRTLPAKEISNFIVPRQEAEKPSPPIPAHENNDHRSAQANSVIPVAIHLFGNFGMTIGERTVKLPASRSVSLLKYLVLHHQYTPREVLMDVFWPDAEPEMARNNLNVAIYNLRRSLRKVIDVPVIEFEEGTYGFAPNLRLWLDVEEFEKCVKAGRRLEARNQLTAAVEEYELAMSLYLGDFLEQNPYEEWAVLDRERLRIAYLDTLDRLSQIYFNKECYTQCIAACQLILARDRCREDAQCLLMRCYSRQGQHHLALRQYQLCVESLRTELQVNPAPETTQLYNRIRRREQV